MVSNNGYLCRQRKNSRKLSDCPIWWKIFDKFRTNSPDEIMELARNIKDFKQKLSFQAQQ
jgi:hypothetical protein